MRISRKDMMVPALREIVAEGECSTSDLRSMLKRHFGLSETDLNARTSRVMYELGWAKTYLKKLGLAFYPRRARLGITASGRRVAACKGCAGRICRRCIGALGADPSADKQYLGAL